MGTNVFVMRNGLRTELTEEENAAAIAAAEQVAADKAAEAAAWEADAWRRNRIEAYGPLADQLDEQYHDFDAWKARIAAVKAQFPKPA